MTKTNTATKTATRAAKAAKPAATPVNKDVIVQSNATAGSNDHLLKSLGGETFTFATTLWAGDIRKQCAIGQSFKAAVAAVKAAPKPKAQLARGITAGDAKQSAKAVADQNRAAKPANKADAATQKAPAAKAGKKAPATNVKGNRPYKWVGENKAREGTWRYAMLDCLAKNTDKDSAAACLKKNRQFGASHQIDFRWCAAQGYIKYTD